MVFTIKNIRLAKNAGFCYGVKRAVDATKKIKNDNPSEKVCVLGELIHNSHVISNLKALGIETIDSIPQKGCGICVIRSHGESEEVFLKLQKAGFELVDLTCLDVKKVQNKAMELAFENYFVIILGKEEHPEVKAICSYAKKYAKDKNNVFVAKDVEALKQIEEKIKSEKKVGLILQTTQTKEFLFEALDYLVSVCKVLKIQNTICPSTALRQSEAKNLAQMSDLMVVVGSKKSANTTHLAQLLQKITDTIHIEDEMELDNHLEIISKSQNIGVTAGASTPETIIKNVMKKLENY